MDAYSRPGATVNKCLCDYFLDLDLSTSIQNKQMFAKILQ